LKEAVQSNCDTIRFGSEFCEQLMPNMEVLKKAYNLVDESKKEFIYITPRLSNNLLKKIRDQLTFLNDQGKKVDVVINDLGMFNVLENYSSIKPRLGRQLVYIPARCPWGQITEQTVGFLAKRRVEKIYYQTSLNYPQTFLFFRKHGIKNIDVDWIPHIFPSLDFLVKKGFGLSVHLFFTPVTITRKCHTARFLDEKDFLYCSKPCNTQAFILKNSILGVTLYLQGNVVYRYIQPVKKDVTKLFKIQASEFVIPMNSITEVKEKQKIDSFIQTLNSKKTLNIRLP
jgi:hypothetical protein